MKRVGRQLNGGAQNGNGAPDQQNDHHHRGDHHDLQGFLAGLVHALRILPPEIGHHDNGQPGGKVVVGEMQRAVHVHAHVLDKPCQILAGGYGADGTGQHVVEQQRRDRKLGQRSAHRFFDHAIDAATNEHTA